MMSEVFNHSGIDYLKWRTQRGEEKSMAFSTGLEPSANHQITAAVGESLDRPWTVANSSFWSNERHQQRAARNGGTSVAACNATQLV
jgi:hypothetical protein